MTPEEILLVQESFDVLLPISTAVAERFYQHLFDVAPTVRSRFPEDMRGQYDMLMAVINTAVHGLWQPDALVPILQQLGRRHVAYGTYTTDYDLVGEVLRHPQFSIPHGTRASTTVPPSGRAAMRSVPPSASTLSRMPVMP